MSDIMETKDDDYQRWFRDSVERQQLSYTRYGDREWDEIRTCRVDHLRTKISWHVFNKNYEDLLETDEKKEKSAVDDTIVKLKNSSEVGTRLLLGYVYVDVLLKDGKSSCIIPLIKSKIPNDERTTIYELHSGRVYYGGWKAYEEENKLPPCWMCYPEEGTYRGEWGQVVWKCCESPSCHTILPTVDAISLIGGVVCTGVLTVTSFLLPPLFAVEVAAFISGTGVIGSGIYGVTRGISELWDRSTHEQSCSLFDPAAFRQWLNIILSAGCALTAGGSVLARAPVIFSAGTKATAAMRLAATVLKYVSVGVNGLGIVLIIIDLVIKCMNNRLLLSDLNSFVSLCLLICNIIITTDQAERLIKFIANQPQRMRNAFNMVRNTTIATVKTIREYVPFEEILHLITGDVAMNILRRIGLPRTATTISFVRNRIRRIRNSRNVVDMMFVLQDILRHCFLFFEEILLEVREALSKLEKWFNVALPNFVIRTRRIFFGDVALEVADEVDRILDDMEVLEPSIRDNEARNIVAVVNNVANEVECSTETEYMAITELVCARLGSMCNTEINLQRHNPTSYLTDDRKSELFRKILSHFDQSSDKKEIEERFRSERQNFSAIRKNLIFYKPIYQSAQNSVYYFEKSSESFTFSQFVYDAACELLGTDDLFEEGREFHLHDYETIFCVRDGDRSLIFNYEIEKSNGKVRGIVITDE